MNSKRRKISSNQIDPCVSNRSSLIEKRTIIDCRNENSIQPEFRLTNYSVTHNPLIFLLMQNFMKRVSGIMTRFEPWKLKGMDAGCGEGHLTKYLVERGVVRDITGVDSNLDHLSFAQRYHPVCPYVKADLCCLPFGGQTFDYVICTEVLEHIPNPELVLLEWHRVLRKEGHLVISVPHEPFFHWGNRLRGQYPETDGWTPDHVNRWYRKDFFRLLHRYAVIHVQWSWSTFPWLIAHATLRS